MEAETQQHALSVSGIRAPVVPSASVIESHWKLAQYAARSGMARIRNEYDAFFIIEYGHELGISPMSSLRTIYSVNGVPTCSGEAMLALIRRSGKAEKIEIGHTETSAYCYMKRADTGEDYRCEFTLADAERAELYFGANPKNSKENWRKYPSKMMRWRCVSECAKFLFSDVIGGLYTVEEISPDTLVDEYGAPLENIIQGQVVNRPDQSQAPQTDPQHASDAPPKPKPASETWLVIDAAKQRLQKRLVDAGYTESDQAKWLSKLDISRFGEFAGTETEMYQRLQVIGQEIAAEMPPAQPKSAKNKPVSTPAPATDQPLANPVVVDRVKYIEQGNQKYLVFSTGNQVIRFYGRSSKFKTLVGPEFYAANKFEDMEPNTKTAYGIAPVEIAWEEKAGYLAGKDAHPIVIEDIGGVDIDDWFKKDEKPTPAPSDSDEIPEMPDVPEGSKDIAF